MSATASFSASISNSDTHTAVQINKIDVNGINTVVGTAAPGSTGSLSATLNPGDRLKVQDAGSAGSFSCSGSWGISNDADAALSFDAVGTTPPVALGNAQAATATASGSFSLSSKNDVIAFTLS